MVQIADAYNEIFKPKDQKEKQLYLEGTENCVSKNLCSTLFGNNGIGMNPHIHGKKTLPDGSIVNVDQVSKKQQQVHQLEL